MRIKYIEVSDFRRKTEETDHTDRAQEDTTARKTTQDAERPQQLVVQVAGRLKVSGKLE